MRHKWENGYIVRALNQLASLAHEFKGSSHKQAKTLRTAAQQQPTRMGNKISGIRRRRTIASFLILIASVAILRRVL